jgi:hypothetical protein
VLPGCLESSHVLRIVTLFVSPGSLAAEASVSLRRTMLPTLPRQGSSLAARIVLPALDEAGLRKRASGPLGMAGAGRMEEEEEEERDEVVVTDPVSDKLIECYIDQAPPRPTRSLKSRVQAPSYALSAHMSYAG